MAIGVRDHCLDDRELSQHMYTSAHAIAASAATTINKNTLKRYLFVVQGSFDVCKLCRKGFTGIHFGFDSQAQTNARLHALLLVQYLLVIRSLRFQLVIRRFQRESVVVVELGY